MDSNAEEQICRISAARRRTCAGVAPPQLLQRLPRLAVTGILLAELCGVAASRLRGGAAWRVVRRRGGTVTGGRGRATM